MRTITEKEMEAVLRIVKSPERQFNANSLAKELDISAMGALKILKRLEREGVLKSDKVMQARMYKVDENVYAKQYVSFLLARERKLVESYVKVWINEIKKIKNADLAILFGSVIRKKSSNDIDVMLLTDENRFKDLGKEVAQLNKLSVKPIHPLYQSYEDIVENIRRRDKPLLNAIKGVVVFGEDVLMGIYHESCKK